MRFNAVNIFIAVTILLRSIGAQGSGLDLNIALGSDGEPIRAEPEHPQQLTLAELFPGSEGIHLPPVEVVQEPQSFERLYAHIVLRFNGANGPPTPFNPHSFLVKRDRVIIGVLYSDIIRPVTSPRNEPDIVYDTGNNRWVKLKPFEMYRLGLDQRFTRVQSTDITFGADLPNIDNPRYRTLAAHVEARHEGSLYADSIMQAQRRQIDQGIHPINLLTFEQAYQQRHNQAYWRAYRRAHSLQANFLRRRS